MASSEIHLIALKLVKYSDRQSILTAYSLESGCVSFAIRIAGKASSRTRALTMPLSILTAVADVGEAQDSSVAQSCSVAAAVWCQFVAYEADDSDVCGRAAVSAAERKPA